MDEMRYPKGTHLRVTKDRPQSAHLFAGDIVEAVERYGVTSIIVRIVEGRGDRGRWFVDYRYLEPVAPLSPPEPPSEINSLDMLDQLR